MRGRDYDISMAEDPDVFFGVVNASQVIWMFLTDLSLDDIDPSQMTIIDIRHHLCDSSALVIGKTCGSDLVIQTRCLRKRATIRVTQTVHSGSFAISALQSPLVIFCLLWFRKLCIRLCVFQDRIEFVKWLPVFVFFCCGSYFSQCRM